MASIIAPTRKYNVYNQLVGHRESRDAGHDPQYYQNTEDFYAEVLDNTRLELECVSNNNPIDITITGEARDL